MSKLAHGTCRIAPASTILPARRRCWRKNRAYIGKSPTDMKQCSPAAADWSIGPNTCPHSLSNLWQLVRYSWELDPKDPNSVRLQLPQKLNRPRRLSRT